MYSIGYAVSKRIMYFWSMTIFILFLPVFLIADNYDLYRWQTYQDGWKLTIAGMMVSSVIIIYFRKKVLLIIPKWKFGVVRSMFDIVFTGAPVYLIWAILYNIHDDINDLVALMPIFVGSYSLGLVFKQFYDKWAQEVVELRRFKKYANKEIR